MDFSMHPFDMIDNAMADVLRSKSEADRLAIAHGMWRSARRMLHSMLRADHPDWSDKQIQYEVARRISHGAV